MNKATMLLILITQLNSCQKMEKLPNYKTEKFEWDGDATAPKGYSMIIVSPNYFRLEGIKLALIPDMSSMEYGWGGSARSWSVGDSFKTMPDSLHIAWFSNTENKFYEGYFKMPQEKLYHLFKEGYMIYSIPIENEDGKAILHKETFSAITVGLAPKGMVVVWASGQNKIEIGRYQAQEVDKVEANRMWKYFFKGVGGSDPGDMPLKIPEAELKRFLPHVQEEINQGKISSKRWDDYRLRYNWKVEFNKPLELYRYYIRYFNSEHMSFLPSSLTQKEFNKDVLEPKSKVVPNNFGLYVTAQNGKNYLIRIQTFDEQETIEAFKELKTASPETVITMHIEVDDTFNEFSVTLKNDKKEIRLKKCDLVVFTLDKTNDLKNEM